MRSRRVRRALALGTACIVLAGSVACESKGDDDSDTEALGRRTDGPLSANMDVGGGVSLQAPRGGHRWTGTFGSAILCTTTGQELTIEDVRYEYDTTDFETAPIETVAMLRLVPAEGAADGLDRSPIGSLKGEPSELGVAGTFSTDLEVTITARCDDQRVQDSYYELVTVATYDSRGGRVDHWWIDYNAGGTAYTLPVDWKMTGCPRGKWKMSEDGNCPAL